jgi:AcrR family transcriptional regulator
MTTARVRSQYHHGDLEHALIATARKMVKRNGSDELSLRKVAHEVGVSPSAVYHYFPDRNSMLGALGKSLFEELADYQDAKLAEVIGNSHRAVKERFRTLGRTYFDWAIKEPHFFNLMFSDFCLLTNNGKNPDESRAFNNLTSCLDELLATGLIDRKIRPYGELIAWSSVHGATSLIVAGHLQPEEFDQMLDGLELAMGIRRSAL